MHKLTLTLLLALPLVGCASGGLPGLGPVDPLMALAIIMGTEAQVPTNTMTHVAGQPTKHSSVSVPDKAPDEPGTDILRSGFMARWVDTQEASDIEAQFPEGQGPNGFTVKANSTSMLQAGYYLFPFLSTSGNIPVTDNGRYYQYAAVFDRDNNESNNFVPIAAFAKDFFRNSDTWIQYTNEQGVLAVTLSDAQNNNILQLPTGTIAIISGNTLMFMIPMADIPTALPCYAPLYRTSAFCHDGGFGLTSPFDWSGSVRPDQLDPLATLSTEGHMMITPRIRLRADYLGVDANFLDSIGLPETFSFTDSLFGGNSFSNGHMQTITTSSDFTGGKGDPAINVIPAMSEKGTLFPCLRPLGQGTGNPASAFVSFPVPGAFMVDPSRFMIGPSAWADGMKLSIMPDPVAKNPMDLVGTFMDEPSAAMLIAQALGISGNVHFQKEFEVFDGQIANIVLNNELANVVDLEPDFRAAVEAFDSAVTQVRAAIPLHIYPHASADFNEVMLELRVDSKSVTFETANPVPVGGVDHHGLVPFTKAGRLITTIPIPVGQAVLLGGQRDFGQTQILKGVPILAEIPVLNRLFAATAEIPQGKTLIILITAQIIKNPE